MRLINIPITEVGKFAAYWAKGQKVYEAPTTHVRFIMSNIEIFDIDMETIKSIHRKHGEKLGQEGKAREEIIKKVAKDGWIRVRHYQVPKDYWTIQFDNFRRRRHSISGFIDYALDNLKMSMNDSLSLVGYDDNYSKTYDFVHGGVSAFLMERRKKRISLS